MSSAFENTTAIILAGGLSSRMGEDKGLMLFNQKPMIQYVIDSARNVCQKILIVSNNAAYEQFGFEVVKDEEMLKGPLMGIISGLEQSKTDRNLILSCDVPFVSTELLSELMDHADDAAVIVCEKDDRIHPLIGHYNKRILPALREQLTLNKLKLMQAIQIGTVKELNCDQFSESEFRNINSRIDL